MNNDGQKEPHHIINTQQLRNKKILSDFDQSKELYKSFGEKMKSLIEEILIQNKIKYHTVTFRPKEREKLAEKLNRPRKHYGKLSDVTDIAGLRITTFFEDDVDIVSEIICKEFDIDVLNSIDKRIALEPDRFGYLSIHHVVALKPERLALTEYMKYRSIKAEIQTRSILQHAWAEIVHDLDYKSETSIPRIIKRRFSRLAGLLELADQEFITVRNDLTSYEKTLLEAISNKPDSVNIDQASLKTFVSTSQLVRELDKLIAEATDAAIQERKDFADDIKNLHYFGIQTISELEAQLKEKAKLIFDFAILWFKEAKAPAIHSGISLYFLCYILIANSRDKGAIETYLKAIFPALNNKETFFAQRILDVYLDINQGDN